MNKTVYVDMKNICKTFGVIRANHDINFSVYKGEIHGLLGENGAGKSTLVNMLSGIYTPDSGSISIYNENVNIHSLNMLLNLNRYDTQHLMIDY